MKKVLIFKPSDYLKPIGGPAGYLFNLKEGIDQVKSSDLQIDFLPKENTERSRKEKLKKNHVVKKLINSKTYNAIKHYFKTKNDIASKKNFSIDLDSYGAVHFHTTMDLYSMRDHIGKYKGKVVLTPHSPEPLYQELVGKMGIMKLIDRSIEKTLMKSDKYAFLRADYIVLPCEYADEYYLKAWSDYKDIKREKNQYYRYLFTGVQKREVRSSRQRIRDEYNIPEGAFVIGFVGRHNEAKGYDRLLRIGEIILNRYKDVYFLIGGLESPIKGLKNDRWIEIGWTDYPQDLINASDIFVLPNKETYFDIVLLEALSLGKVVVASKTGGNKTFVNEEGVRLFEDDAECVEIIEKLMSIPKDSLKRISEKNLKLYNKSFNEKAFAEHYIEVMDSILVE
ncbi:glycosyltransferase [Butyrivibrio sp. XB500-5]|uniref:glycosyltransferase family 4 protein n=1 Tax=Butyrivibrio sp. XB500-5 TaxID=2364880 RepID=UPI000EAA8274|nr:glycosyltransferase family 4 protein [Butyrivibrio sp. XB500-5]RKM60700.1 glycosyltransferase [Butyrivibrio sp. XB500-5]